MENIGIFHKEKYINYDLNKYFINNIYNSNKGFFFFFFL